MSAPSPQGSARPRTRRRLLIGFIVLLLTVGGLALSHRLRPSEPSWKFDFSSVTEPRDVAILLRLARQCEQVEAWAPEVGREEMVVTLARHVTNPANAGA